MNYKLKPVENNIVLEPIEEEKETKSGLIIPETAQKEKPTKAKVVAVGSGKLLKDGKRYKMPVKINDIVLFKKYSPDEVEVKKKKYLVGDVNDILVIVEKKN